MKNETYYHVISEEYFREGCAMNKEDREMQERTERIKGFFTEELKDAPFIVTLSYVERSEFTDKEAKIGVRTIRASNALPHKTDFMTYKTLLTALQADVNNFVASLFPPMVPGKPKTEEGSHYG